MIEQTRFPAGPPWNPGPPDLTGYTAPHYSAPTEIAVTVVGTVRDEQVAFDRSWSIWSRQEIPDWLTVEYLVLDDGSAVPFAPPSGVRCVHLRGPGAPERSCTLAFNHALRNLVRTPYVMFQWWDRIPGSFSHLLRLCMPHRWRAGIVTSAVARHIGGSSSVQEMAPEALAARLAMVDWQADPSKLAQVAGPIGAHCVPGQATESAGFVVRVEELLALGGWDERYTARSSYVNVELWRRMLQAGLVALFVPEPAGANYHQSHPSGGGRQKDMGWLHDRTVVRNRGVEWGIS